MHKIFLFVILGLLSTVNCMGERFEKSFESSRVLLKERTLTVSTGTFTRIWEISSYGMATTSIMNERTKKEWVNMQSQKCDWEYYGLIDENSKCDLVNIVAIESTDSGFTSPHLLIELEFEYPAIETFVKYQIRAYPNAEGLYTALAFKGNSGKYIQQQKSAPKLGFSLKSGNEKYDYAAHGFSGDYIAHYTYDNNTIEYLIDGLDKTKSYRVGISWWDFNDSNTHQKLVISSVDGENRHVVFDKHKVPSYTNKEKPEYLNFDLPENVLLDGSFRLFVEKQAGKNALISEIWIVEKSSNNHEFTGNADRIAELKQLIEPTWSLVGYINCGESDKIENKTITGRVDFLPINTTGLTRRYIGYYNDTQHRNKLETPLLKEIVLNSAIGEVEKNNWASILLIEEKSDALIVVKESHKCVNQYGHDTGDFEISKNGISNTGTSLLPNEILPNKYRNGWASWVIAAANGTDERELALKKFERLRFPVNPETDIYMIANTWGSDRGINASTESNVMVELQSQHDLGIDVQQIDDGWQKNLNGKFNGKWHPSPERFPNGFGSVRKRADSLGLELGLWFAAQPVSLQEMKDNYDAGHFASYKLDFANIRNHDDIDKMVQKIRAYELYTNHKSKVNWDVTENAPRFGYFWAKEYGCVFLENRKPALPENVVYTPYLVLRDLWHLSKYCNLNKFQGSVQNIDKVDTVLSDANKYNHPYSAAIALMSTPLFFQETQFYSSEAKDQIKEVLTAYKSVRNDIYETIVYPIGNEPNNASWSGFQAHHPEKKIGFITLFRELENKELQKRIQLRFVKGQKLAFTNLITGVRTELNADNNGFVNFEIEKNADFLFLQYMY